MSRYQRSDFGELVGQTIKQISMNPEQTALEFLAESGERYCYMTAGCCCNDVWFNHISGIEAIVDGTVSGVEVKGWTDVEATRQEVEEAGFWTIQTEKGRFDIEVRNSHNGYYGGWVDYWSQNLLIDPVIVTEDF
jgi:hypothetical protein